MSFLENIPEFSWYLLYTVWYLFLILIITLLLQFIVYCCSAYISLVYSISLEFWDYIVLPCYKLIRAVMGKIKKSSDTVREKAFLLQEMRSQRYKEYLEKKTDEVEAELYEEYDIILAEAETKPIPDNDEATVKKPVKKTVKKGRKKVEPGPVSPVKPDREKYSPYMVFGLTEAASLEECRQVYEELRAAYNPDKYESEMPDMKMLYDQVQNAWQQIQEMKQAKS